MSRHSKSVSTRIFTFSLIALAAAFLFSAEQAKPPKVASSRRAQSCGSRASPPLRPWPGSRSRT